jgi:hypothetical protein
MFVLTAIVCAALALVSPAPVTPAPAPALAIDDGGVYASVAESVAPAIVAVKFVMAMDGGENQDNEIHGVLIDPAGIVLVSSASMFGVEGMGMSIRPQEIKILVGDDTAGLEAEVLVRDRERDLAWLRITEEVESPLPAIDFAAGAEATLGQTVLQVWKLDKFFDRAPYISEGRVAAQVSKPRNLFIASGEITIGLPVVNVEGSPLGFGVLQLPTQEEMAAMSGSNMYSRMIFARTILPAAEVAEATTQALATLDEDEEE